MQPINGSGDTFGSASPVVTLGVADPSPMTIFTGVLVLVFGSLTLWLQNEIFIKVKVTIQVALVLIVSE